MELLIAAGIPSAIVAFCFWLLEKRIQERAEVEKNERACRQREQDEKEENREKLQYMMLKALDGSLWRCRGFRMRSATEICTLH